MGKLKEAFVLLKDTFGEWNRDHAATWAAALAYYTIFSVGPLLLIAVSIAGLVFGQQAAQGQIADRIGGIVGNDAAQAVQGLLQAANKPASGIIGSVIGFVTLLLGASGFFGQLQTAINQMWKVTPPKRGILRTVMARGLTFLMVLGVGVLLIALLAASTAISVVTGYFGQFLPSQYSGFLLGAVDFLVSFLVITVVFAAIYRVLPDTRVAWKDVWIGAAFTSLLFVVGKLALGIYIGRASVGSAFGAAGSLVVLLVWIYYSAQIFLFGAEFTHVYSKRYGPKRAQGAPNLTDAAPKIAERVGQPETGGREQGVGKEAAIRLEPMAKGTTTWQVGRDRRRSTARSIIAPLSIAAGVVAAIIVIIRGRREAT